MCVNNLVSVTSFGYIKADLADASNDNYGTPGRKNVGVKRGNTKFITLRKRNTRRTY